MCTRLAGQLALAMLIASAEAAAETTLTIVDADGAAHRFPIEALLARPDVETVTVTGDPAYGDATPAYRAIALTGLLSGLPVQGADILEATARDGFVAQLPAGKALSGDPAGARAYLAIEDPAKPWPKLPGKDVTAGPYYLVWRDPKRSGIGPEAWPYQAVILKLTASVASRFPAIVVAGTLATDDPARRGQAVFVDNCFACHRMNGAGEASIGPDLNLPMNPTEYFRPAALRTFIRSPKSVRDWPEQRMPGFGPSVLGDRDLDDLIAYLGHMARRR